MGRNVVRVNRAPVLTLWSALVAVRLGFDPDEALTLGKAVAGLTAQAKGRRMGVYKKTRDRRRSGLGEDSFVELCGRAIPVKRTAGGVRAVVRDKPIDPGKVRAYLEGKFGSDLAAAERALWNLARRMDPEELASEAFRLYEAFRPVIPEGTRGWGRFGELDLDLIAGLGR